MANRLQRPVFRRGPRPGAFVYALSPIAWYRFGRGITVATGISQWNDQSGNGNHLLQSSATSQPALQSDGSIVFDGVNDYLKTANFTLPQPVSVYMLVNQITSNAGYVWDGATINDCGIRQTGSPTLTMNAGTDGPATAAGTPALGSYVAVGAVYNGASSTLQLNQGTATVGSVGSNVMGGLTIAVRGDVPAGTFSNIQVKEIIVFPAAHDSATVSRINRYLQSIGGL